jgi:amino acid transporter
VPRALPRVLGLFDIAILAAASMGPAYSLAATMGPMVAAAGEHATLALALLAAIILCIAIAFAQLSSRWPNAGSSFTWIGAAFGPFAGAYGAWLLLLSNYFATMATALPAGIYTLDLFAPGLATSPLWDALVGVIWIVVSALLLAGGLRPTAFATALFLFAEFAVIAATVVAALLVHPAPERIALPAGVALPGWAGILPAMVLAIWMTDGWEVSASASEESTGSATTPGRGGIVGLVVTVAILLAAMAAYLHVGSVAGFTAHETDALAYVGDRLGGGGWRIAIVATVLVSTAATLWTTLLYLSRSVFAMGRDGVLPLALGNLDARGLPVNALFAVSFGVSLFTLLTGLWPTAAGALNLILDGTSVFLGLLFVASACAAVRMLSALRGETRLVASALPALGAVTLLAVIGYTVFVSDPATRGIELGGLVLGIPFMLWRGRGAALAREESLARQPGGLG